MGLMGEIDRMDTRARYYGEFPLSPADFLQTLEAIKKRLGEARQLAQCLAAGTDSPESLQDQLDALCDALGD